MSTDDSIDWFLLERYFAEQCLPGEQASVEAWLAEKPEYAELGRRVQLALAARARQRGGEWGRASAIESVLGQVRPPHRDVTYERSERASRWSVWYTVAAVVVVLIITVLSWSAGVHHVNERVSASALTYVTGNGQRATITLPDGSTVILNVASRLQVPTDFVTGHHVVRLDGEGLFTVTHHDGQVFTVVAGTTTARVLGTSFIVKHYDTDSTSLVAVQNGKVAVRTTVLTAAQAADITSTGSIETHPTDPSQFSFATGVLTLTRVPLPQAITELDRWYDTDIRLADSSLVSQQLTAKLAAGSLGDLMLLLEDTFGVRAVRTGRVITLFSR